jgi:hypothetical protein
VGTFISPDTLVPDPANVWDYNRFGYARLNPMKFNDPTGHCATLEDGSPNWEGEVNYQCWQTAYAIYGYGAAGLAAFQQDWKVAADDWLENIAKQEFATTEYLTPFLNEYNSLFCAQTGLQCGNYQPNPVPPQALETLNAGIQTTAQQAYTTICVETWDCPGLALDTASLLTSIAQSAAATCTTMTGPVCGSAAGYLTFLDVSLTTASTLYTIGQYPSGGSSEADLAVSVADVYITVRTVTSPASSIPYVGVGYDLAVLAWGLVKPFVDQPSVAR